MTNALTVDGNKVLVELEWEQIDTIVRNEIRDHIYMTHREMKLNKYIHPDDVAQNEKLLPALLIIYEYYAGEEELKKVQEILDADETV